jgi:hypothetical protein
MQTIQASEVFVFDAYRLIVVRTHARSARTARTKTLRIDNEVTLHGGGRKIRANPVGTGSHRGHATILLRPRGDFGRALESLARMLEGGAIELRSGGASAERGAHPGSGKTLASVVVDTTP